MSKKTTVQVLNENRDAIVEAYRSGADTPKTLYDSVSHIPEIAELAWNDVKVKIVPFAVGAVGVIEVKQETVEAETPDLESRVAFLESEIKQIKQAGVKQQSLFETYNRDSGQQVKQKIKHNVGKWNVVESGGFWRAFRNFGGDVGNKGVYIGKEWTPELAKRKIQEKGYPVD